MNCGFACRFIITVSNNYSSYNISAFHIRLLVSPQLLNISKRWHSVHSGGVNYSSGDSVDVTHIHNNLF